MSQIDRDLSSVAHARHIGQAVLFVDTQGNWSVGMPNQKFTDYKPIKVNGQAGVNDDSYEFTALIAEPIAGGYRLTLRANGDESSFITADFDAEGNYLSHRPIGLEELFAIEARNNVDLNGNGGIGNAKVLVDAGQGEVFLDGAGNYLIRDTNGTDLPLTMNGQQVSMYGIAGYSFEDIQKKADKSGFTLYVSDSNSNLYSVETQGAVVQLNTLRQLSATDIANEEAKTGSNINDKPDQAVTQGWSAALKTAAIRNEVDALIAGGQKITHAGALKIVESAVKVSANGSLGQDVFDDLKAIAARGDGLFSSPNLTGQESGYLSFVFGQLVNGSKANAFFTGGSTKADSLGNLGASSTAAQLQLLSRKWLLGEDLPNPTTEGDTANPGAKGGAGIYQPFKADLFVGGADMLDVNQGNAGTCYLLASMAALAKVNPRAFENVFTTNPAGADGAQSWGVRFFGNDGKTSWVTVNNQLVVREAGESSAAYAKVKGVDSTGQMAAELWAPLLEKAYAQANELKIFGRDNSSNSMLAIEGGLADSVAHLVGGKMTKFADAEQVINDNPLLKTTALTGGLTELAGLVNVINGNKLIWIGSDNQTQNDAGLTLFTKGHAYMAYDAEPANPNNSTVLVYNPWGPTGDAHASPFQVDLAGVVGQNGYDFWFSAV
jgi:hypothetical protein